MRLLAEPSQHEIATRDFWVVNSQEQWVTFPLFSLAYPYGYLGLTQNRDPAIRQKLLFFGVQSVFAK